MNQPVLARQQAQQATNEQLTAGHAHAQGALVGAHDPDFQRLLSQQHNPRGLVLGGDKFERMYRLAELMASGKSTLPKHLQGNTSDCMAVVMQAMSWNANPWGIAQKTYLTPEGKLGYESQLVGAILNSSGAIKDAALNCEYFGPWEKVIGNVKEMESRNGGTYRKLATTIADEKGVGIKVWGTLAGESAPRVLELLLLQAGVRNSTLWANDPQQQLFYLAQLRWSRKFAPGVILGLFASDDGGPAYDGDEGDDITGAPPPARGPQRKSASNPPPPATSPAPATAPATAKAPDPETGEVAPPPAATSAPTPPASSATGRISENQAKYLRKKLADAGASEQETCERYGVERLEDLTVDAFDERRAELLAG